MTKITKVKLTLEAGSVTELCQKIALVGMSLALDDDASDEATIKILQRVSLKDGIAFETSSQSEHEAIQALVKIARGNDCKNPMAGKDAMKIAKDALTDIGRDWV